jgi:CheY-like chemotaxis protein
MGDKKVNVLLVDDQPAKLLSYEVMLEPLGENLVKASSAKEALEHLLKMDIAVILVDVCMPDLDGFELRKRIRCADTGRARSITCRCRSCRRYCGPRCECSPNCTTRRGNLSS